LPRQTNSFSQAQKQKKDASLSSESSKEQVKLELYSPRPHVGDCEALASFSIKFKVFIITDLHIKKAIHGKQCTESDDKFILKIQLFTFLNDLPARQALVVGFIGFHMPPRDNARKISNIPRSIVEYLRLPLC
jgi:hypothetical protein